MEFFKLNHLGEDKVVSREQRIFSDALLVDEELVFLVTTTSKAKRLRIQFYLDAIKYTTTNDDDEIIENTYKIGEFITLEHGQVFTLTDTNYATLINQEIPIEYWCDENDGFGNFTVTIDTRSFYTLYISAIQFDDSFYNYNYGWYNPDNPQNLFDLTKEDPINAATRLPQDGFEGDIIEHLTDNEIRWISKKELIDSEDMPKATPDDWGVVKVDGTTIISRDGVISSTGGGGAGSGNVTSAEVDIIRVLTRLEYDAIVTKGPNTLYLITG